MQIMPVMLMPSIARFMTVDPVTIDHASTLAVARRLMQAHKIRHLPVITDGRLAGVVSERELHLLEQVARLDPETVRVEQAMTPNPFVVTADMALDEIAEIMAEHKYGSVVVLGRGGVEGIFTMADACRALTTILRQTVDDTP